MTSFFKEINALNDTWCNRDDGINYTNKTNPLCASMRIAFSLHNHESWVAVWYTNLITGIYCMSMKEQHMCLEWQSHISYLEPSWYFLSKEVLREMAAWAYWNICWLGEGRSGPWVGETRDSGSPWGTWVILCQPGPVPIVLYSMMGTRYSSEAPLKNTKENYHGFLDLLSFYFWTSIKVTPQC